MFILASGMDILCTYVRVCMKAFVFFKDTQIRYK